jgi:transcriptional regulator of heat shock response
LSRLARTVAMTAWPNRGDVHDAGWRELLDSPQAPELAAMKEISQLVDVLDSHLDDVAQLGEHNTAVFIGQENPLFAAKHTSLIIRTIDAASGEKTVLVLAGSKRMPYGQHLQLLESVAHFLEGGTL